MSTPLVTHDVDSYVRRGVWDIDSHVCLGVEFFTLYSCWLLIHPPP